MGVGFVQEMAGYRHKKAKPEREYQLERKEQQFSHRVTRRHHVEKAARLLSVEGEEATIGSTAFDAQSAEWHEMPVPIGGEAAAKMIGGHVYARNQRCCDGQQPARLEYAGQFRNDFFRMGNVLQNLGADYPVKGGVGHWNGSNVADVIQFAITMI